MFSHARILVCQRTTDMSEICLDSLIVRVAPDRALAEPSYQQLYRKLAEQIECGAIADGQSLPSERVLAESLGLSRATVRRAYDELCARRYIETLGRAGWQQSRRRA
jgi:GntR family transcriptional regulator